MSILYQKNQCIYLKAYYISFCRKFTQIVSEAVSSPYRIKHTLTLMKITRLPLILLFVFLLSNCSKSETPIPQPDAGEQPDTEEPPEPQEPITEVYFTLNVLSPRQAGSNAEWVIIHDENGNLLDYKQYEVGDVLKFEAAVDSLTDKISVTELQYIINEDGNRFHSLSTTTEVLKGSEWTIGTDQEPPTSPTITKTGEFDLTVSNIPNPLRKAFPSNVVLTSGRGFLGQSASGTGYSHGIEITFNGVPHYEGFDEYIMSILDANNDLKIFLF